MPAATAAGRSPLLSEAIASYLEDCRARQLAPATIVSYSNTLGHLRAAFPALPAAQITLDDLTRYRAKRPRASSQKELVTLRAFFGFAHDRNWASSNPAAKLKAVKTDRIPTLPFTPAEVQKILEASSRIDNPNPREIPRARVRARALVLLLLYSGFRISDAVKLRREALNPKTGQLLIRMMKTRAPLYVRLPEDALRALAEVPVESPYYFWSGRAKLSTAVGSARRTIDCVLKLAGIQGHPHRFRDTFSVGLLNTGAELRTVQLLLGHSSIRTTEKHYAPFVQSMQRTLDAAVARLDFSGTGEEPVDDALADAAPRPQLKLVRGR